MEKSFIPDLSSRPHSMRLELQMKADAASIYNAWTRDFDLWFAEPGELIMTPAGCKVPAGAIANSPRSLTGMHGMVPA